MTTVTIILFLVLAAFIGSLAGRAAGFEEAKRLYKPFEKPLAKTEVTGYKMKWGHEELDTGHNHNTNKGTLNNNG